VVFVCLYVILRHQVVISCYITEHSSNNQTTSWRFLLYWLPNADNADSTQTDYCSAAKLCCEWGGRSFTRRAHHTPCLPTIENTHFLKNTEEPYSETITRNKTLCRHTACLQSVAGAYIWNGLPADVTSAPSLPVFRQRLKTVLFSRSYSNICVIWTLSSFSDSGFSSIFHT